MKRIKHQNIEQKEHFDLVMSEGKQTNAQSFFATEYLYEKY